MNSAAEQIEKLTNLHESNVDGGFNHGEMILQSVDKSPGTEELTQLVEASGTIGDNGRRGPAGIPGHANPKGPSLTSLDQPRKIKRKKSKPKSNHLPNMRNARTKSALGAAILGLLGKVQQDTQDSYKRSLLKEIPLADFVELASGEKLPDYQANLLNAMQAKADPAAPIVERVNAGSVPAIQKHVDIIKPMMGNHYAESLSNDAPRSEELDNLIEVGNNLVGLGRGLTKHLLQVDDSPVQLSNDERQTIFEENLDNALARYITPEVFPEGTTDEARANVVAQVRTAVLDRNMSIDRQTLVTEAMSIVHPVQTITA